MPSFSEPSRRKLATCHRDLQILAETVVRGWDCTVVYGHRGQEAQDRLFSEGKSKLRFPDSKHNSTPSRAIDLAPYPVDWLDEDRFLVFGGYVLGIAAQLGLSIRWGGDWNGDRRLTESFRDLAHFELAGD